MTESRIICSRCAFETGSLEDYWTHINTHFPHVAPPTPPPAPEWHPTLSREIL